MSIISLLGSSSPFSSVGSIGILISGASMGFVVSGHTVIDAVASKGSFQTGKAYGAGYSRLLSFARKPGCVQR